MRYCIMHIVHLLTVHHVLVDPSLIWKFCWLTLAV